MPKKLLALIPLAYISILLFQTDLAMLADLGRHLKLGEIILDCRCVPQTNLFSYTHPDFPIINHEWLSQVIFYFVASAFGLNALLIFKMIIVLLSATIIYKIALSKASAFWVTIFSLLSITIFSMRFSVLPELFSYLFIALFILILEKYKKQKNMKLLYLLPLLEILWVNMHIYFILGITIYGFFFLEQILKNKKLNFQLMLIGFLLIFSTLLNPGFIRGALLPFTFSTNYGFNVEENNSPLKIFEPTSTNTNIAYTLVLQVITFEILVILFIFTLFFKKQWSRMSDTGNALTAGFLGLSFTRCLSLFGLMGLIPLAQAVTDIEQKLKKHLETPMLNIFKGLIIIIVLIIIGIHLNGLLEYNILRFGFMPSAEKAAEFIKNNNINGRIFNNYIIGNYLIYALYPKELVYIDARPESYPASFFDNYWRMMTDEKFFNDQVKKYAVNAVVFNVLYEDPSRSRPFLIRLLESKEWIPVYADGTVTILIKNTPENKNVINKYQIELH